MSDTSTIMLGKILYSGWESFNVSMENLFFEWWVSEGVSVGFEPKDKEIWRPLATTSDAGKQL